MTIPEFHKLLVAVYFLGFDHGLEEQRLACGREHLMDRIEAHCSEVRQRQEDARAGGGVCDVRKEPWWGDWVKLCREMHHASVPPSTPDKRIR